MGNNAKQELYQFVDSLRRHLEIPLQNHPINAFDLWNQQELFCIYQHEFDTHGFCGSAFVGNTQDTIVLNSARSKAEQNFDCTHEVIHLTKHRKQNHGIFKCVCENQNSFLEWEANEGAAQFLVPYQDFIPKWITYSSTKLCKPFDLMHMFANYYQVSVPVIDIRLKSLSYEIDQYKKGVPLAKIELLSRNQQKTRGIQPLSGHPVFDSASR